jgi:hypothetical protein
MCSLVKYEVAVGTCLGGLPVYSILLYSHIRLVTFDGLYYVQRIFVGDLEARRKLGGPKRRWGNDTKIEQGMKWFLLA